MEVEVTGGAAVGGGAAGAAGREAPAVEARGFSFAYPDADALLGPLDWQVPRGAFQLLVGATGSGKTTLLRSLVPALAPQGTRAGELLLEGRPVGELFPAEAASLVGYVSQSPENQIVCDTVWHELAFGLENLGVPQDEMRRRVAEVAHFFGIAPWFRRRTDELSGGQKKILSLAAALVLRPRVLLLDEPTAQLDPVAEKSFLHALFRVNRELGLTVVVATHAPEAMADYATSAAELGEGRLAPVPLARFAAQPLVVGERRPDGPRRSAARHGEKPALVLDDVYARYARASPWVLRGCDLTVRRGSIHALLGGNGCGKSTLLRVAAGVMRPERGRVENALARSQALLPQDPKALFVCDTVFEELCEWQAACGYGEDEVGAALERAGLAGRADVHPFDLSGGEQQLLALAKLLLTRPELLLLDEPTKGLDAHAACMVAHAVSEAAARGATVVVATHDLAFSALLADEVTLLFDGQAACTQTAAEFFSGSLFYQPVENGFAWEWIAGGTSGGMA